MAHDLRILVIGCGSIGQRHIRNLLALKAGDILAFDVLDSQRRAVRGELDLKVSDTLEAAWDFHPQIAIITSPTQTHLSLALQAARGDCHLFIEKPLSHSLDGIDDLLSEISHRQLVTMVGCNMRFHPGPGMVKRLLDDHVVGTVLAARIQTGSYLPRWRPDQDYHLSYSASPAWGGAILDCIHEIDLAWWYFGEAELLAAAHMPAESIGLETDGLAEIILQHDSGSLTSVHLNFVQRDYRRSCQIIGEEGTIYWDYSEKQVRLFGRNGELAQTYSEPDGWQSNQMFFNELKYFLDCARNRKATFNDFALASKVLSVALEARQHPVAGRERPCETPTHS